MDKNDRLEAQKLSVKRTESTKEVGAELKGELEHLKSSHLRAEAVEKIRFFYEELYDTVDLFDEFEAYKEDIENNYLEYKEDFEKYVLPLVGNEEHDLKTVIARADEKSILIKECIRMIILCLTDTVKPKRKGVEESNKITKGRLIESMKEIERYVLSINLSPSHFQTPFFAEIQELRVSFLLDAMNQVLEHASIVPKHFPLLFEQSIVMRLEKTRTSSSQLSISKYIKKRAKESHHTLIFKMDFLGRFLLGIEDAMKRSPKV